MSITIALAGNPNCGKTTLFNALTGAAQYVGNWPGVTVEKKTGKLKNTFSKEAVQITDLPGVYSLSPYTLEEVVTRDYVLSGEPQVLLNLVDATNLERNLYLTTQLIETGLPLVVALNMTDLLKTNGMAIDPAALAQRLGCPVVSISALKNQGLKEAVTAALAAAQKAKAAPTIAFEPPVEEALRAVQPLLPPSLPKAQRRWYGVKLLEQDEKVLASLNLTAGQEPLAAQIAALEAKYDDDPGSVITDQRYAAIQSIVAGAITRQPGKQSLTDRIDKVVTSRLWGLPIFVLVMWLVYYISVSTIGTLVTDFTNDTLVGGIQEWVGGALASLGAADVIISLIVDGIIGGVGAVLGFVPQMAILFLLLTLLEDCGYMVRIAFVMDRIFRHFGLSGKSFIPLLISSGCGVPGIMASKTIEQQNDRRLTIMTATFVPCGAKLPVIALMSAVMAGYATGSTFLAANLAPIMYFIGILAVLVSAVLLKKTKPFAGKASPFVMELPAYHLPSARNVALHVWERLKGFIIKAGTVLFLACVVMWFLGSFGFENGAFGLVEEASASLLAVIGGAIAFLFAPLGFGTWQPVAASLSGFTAKEAILSTMGVLAGLSGEAAEEAGAVASAAAVWFPSAIAGFSFLLFNLLDSPCLAAIATMAQQLGSRKWFWFAILYQNLFAYAAALMVYQLIGLAVGAVAFNLWTVVALAVLAALLFGLLRPDPAKARAKSLKRKEPVYGTN